MGLSNMKFIHKSKSAAIITSDKANFTSDLSLDDSQNIFTNGQNSTKPIKSVLKNASQEGLTTYIIEKVINCRKVNKILTEFPTENLSALDSRSKLITFNNQTSSLSLQNSLRFRKSNRKNKIEKLGLYPIQCNNITTCFSGVIYLPECPVAISHYITLYRLRLDNLTEKEFQNCCLAIGHPKTAERYLQFQDVYRDMKSNHFKESYTINKILSKQNVHLRISDIFEAGGKLLRALVIIGCRQHIVQSVIDFYCFETQGKVLFIIKSLDDYNFLRGGISNKKSLDTMRTVTADEVSCRLSSEMSRTKVSLESMRHPKNVEESQLETYNTMNNLNSVNVLKSEKPEFFTKGNSPCDLVYEPFSNYVRNQRFNSNNKTEIQNSTVSFKGVNYSLVSVIADKTYAYILCKNSRSKFTESSEKDLKSFKLDETNQSHNNQSNSLNRFETLKAILKTEILETFIQRFYGVSLNQIPTGQMYVVQCMVEGRITERETLLNEILIHHTICGKIINKEYKLEVHGQGDLNFVMHLHGNERHIRKCSEQLKREGLARNFKLIHPQFGRIFEEKTHQSNPDPKKECEV